MVQLIYCYDAWCGWCYGFSKVITKLAYEYKDDVSIEVLSGGMILPETPQHFAPIARYIQGAYKRVEDITGVKFGEDFLWHVFHPEETDWYPSSEMPAIALCVFKDYLPAETLAFATDIQLALNSEGRDLTDKEAYRHLLEKYNLPAEEFYQKLASDEHKAMAQYEFALVKQLKVTSYPAVLLQSSDSKFYLLAQGYTDYETLETRLKNVLAEMY